VSGNVPLDGHAAACSNCHRPSGLGTFEGTKRSLPITAPALFAERTAPPKRPAYDDISLMRAISGGISSNGRSLDALMPRYQLASDDAQNLIAYLRHLGADPVPGVTQEEVVVATVIADIAPEAARNAVAEVVQRFVDIKNGGTRQEARRAAASLRHEYGERQARGYRHWRLLRWELHGEPQSWPAQLAALYAADPPFLLLSGTAGEHWPTIHGFCERQRMPCVLPLTDNPPDADRDFYSLYFHGGAGLEGAVTARHLRSREGKPLSRILVVRTETGPAQAAFESFQRVLAPDGAIDVQQRIVPTGARTGENFWRQLLRTAKPEVLVAWVGQEQLVGLDQALFRYELAPRIYTAQAFTHWPRTSPLLVHQDLFFVQPFSLPAKGRSLYLREASWLRSQHLEHLDPLLASQALFACHAVGEQFAALIGNYSREYFMEGLEHMLDGSDMTSVLPRTTLGENQRFISLGAYVVPPMAMLSGDNSAAVWVKR
jgi:hypothetical protein